MDMACCAAFVCRSRAFLFSGALVVPLRTILIIKGVDKDRNNSGKVRKDTYSTSYNVGK